MLLRDTDIEISGNETVVRYRNRTIDWAGNRKATEASGGVATVVRETCANGGL